MTLARTRDLVDDAVAHSSAVLGFNVIGLEHAEGIVLGAERANRPVLLQISQNAIRFRGDAFAPLLAACREIARASEVAVAIHLDHVTDPRLAAALVERAAEFGIGSLMIDASELDYDDNVEATRGVVEQGHAAGLWIESELGTIGGKDGVHHPDARTDPDEARDFVRATGIDGLAVAIGSSHAMTSQNASLDFALLARLEQTAGVPLVLHGSSGVPDDDLARAIRTGIRKVNIGTALNQAAIAAVREQSSIGGSSDPRRFLSAARTGIADATEHLCRVASPRLVSHPL